MSQPNDLDAARDELAERRKGGNFELPNATIHFAPLQVKLLSVDQGGTQAMVEYPGGLREVIHAAEIAALVIEP